MDFITVNNKNYLAKDIDANFICSLEGCDLTLADLGKLQNKMFSFLRAYVAFCGNMDAIEAGNAINEHIINGGTLDSMAEVFAKKVSESGFFQALTARATENNQKATEETKKKTTKEK